MASSPELLFFLIGDIGLKIVSTAGSVLADCAHVTFGAILFFWFDRELLGYQPSDEGIGARSGDFRDSGIHRDRFAGAGGGLMKLGGLDFETFSSAGGGVDSQLEGEHVVLVDVFTGLVIHDGRTTGFAVFLNKDDVGPALHNALVQAQLERTLGFPDAHEVVAVDIEIKADELAGTFEKRRRADWRRGDRIRPQKAARPVWVLAVSWTGA